MRVLLFLCLTISAALAQEERAIDNFAGVGVRAMGLGGAFVGVADDFTAVYWNPAGLAQIRHREVQMAFLRNSRKNKSAFNGAPGFSELSNTRFGSLGGVYPYPVYRGSFVLAAGFNRIKDFDWSLNLKGVDAASSLQADHFFQHEGELSLAVVAAAVEVSPAISLGLTLGLVSGEDEALNEFNWTDQEDIYQERRYLATDTFRDDYERSLYATLGAMVRAPREKPRFRLGATLSTGSPHKIRYVFRGVASDQGYNLVEQDDGTVEEFPDQVIRSSYELSLPLEFGLGAAYEPVRGLLVAGSVHFAEWSQSEYEDADENQLRANTFFENQYKDATRYHLGIEYKLPTIALDLRAGFYTDPIPFVGPRNLDPVANYPSIRIAQDRRFFTLGAGLLVDGVIQIDATWVRGHFEQVEQVEDLIREEHTMSRLFAGVGYRF
jgi:long-subunit fatty acid transport protein